MDSELNQPIARENGILLTFALVECDEFALMSDELSVGSAMLIATGIAIVAIFTAWWWLGVG